ncbi:MAG: transglutaminase-like domain-containing protein [Gemmataceae bacterium]
MISTVVLGLLWAAEPPLRPDLPYSAKRSSPVEYRIEFKAIVTAPQGTKRLQVWIPVPQDDLGQKISESTWETFPESLKPRFERETVFGNRFAYFEIAHPQGAQIFSHNFAATVWQLDWQVDAAKVQRVQNWPASFEPYRRAEKAIVIDERFKKLASELARGKDGPGAEFEAVLAWTKANLTYDHSNTSLIASSAHALTKKRGDCSDYHGLCASLGRALGVPTRVTYGLHLFPKNLPAHCKLEAFLPPYGWVSFDVSETQRLIQRIEANDKLSLADKSALVRAARERLQRGFRDNTWLMHSRGTDYELAPRASQRVPLIATLYAEADGKPLPLPDPADVTKREFAWMTAHRYRANREVRYPFADEQSLKTSTQR